MKKIIAIGLATIIFSGCFKQENNFQNNIEKLEQIFEYYSKEQNYLLQLHNKERILKNYKQIILDKNLCDYAQKHAETMATKGWLYHSSMNELRKADQQSTWVGENIAWGQENEEEVVKAWMNSTGHRWNILGSSYKKVGFGIAKDSKGRIYWCAVFAG